MHCLPGSELPGRWRTRWRTSLPEAQPARSRLVSRCVAQQANQARRIPAAAAARLNARIELIDERAHRQCGAVDAGLGEADREILAHPVDRETEIELVGRHRLAAVVHLPRLRGALADDVEDALDVETCAGSEVEALGQRLDQARDADLIDHLGELA